STACVSFFSNHRRGARVPGGHGPACRTSTRAPRRTAWRNRPVTAFQAVLGSRSNWTAGFRRKPATLHFGIRAAPIRRYNSDRLFCRVSFSRTFRLMTRVLVTGAAGFIGFHVSRRLLARGDEVVGLDNVNAYYDVRLKEARLEHLIGERGLSFRKLELGDREATARMFVQDRLIKIVHLAAQAGVRYSLTNPHAYVDSNLMGFMNILEGCRHNSVEHLVYASSSSVYGANTKMPFSVHQNVDHP